MTDPAASPLDALKPLAGRALEQALNRLVELDPDTAEALRGLGGRRIGLALEAPPIALELAVADGRLVVGPPRNEHGDEPDLGVRATLSGVLSQLPFLRPPAPGQWPRLVAVCLANGVLHFGLSFWALSLASTLASPAIVMQSYVPMAALLAWALLGERFGWRTGAAIAAAAAVLMAPLTLLYPDMGFSFFIKGFAAAVLGGLTSLPGAVVGGIAIGVIEALAGGYLHSSFIEVSAFIVIMFVLVARPTGLFGSSSLRRV